MNDELDHLLERLSLKRVHEILDDELQVAQDNHSSYSDFLARLLRSELAARKIRSLEYRIRQARMPERWAIETFPFDRQPGVNPAVIRELAGLDFIPAARNIVFQGSTGVGKTGLALGILLKALENGYRGYFVRAQDLFDEMYASLADRSTRNLLNQLRNYDLIVIDEMGYLNLKPEQSNIFFKLMEERYNRKSTIITTNLAYEDWYDFLGQKQMVAALLDRLRHRCNTIHIEGPSLRTPTP
jgi:DNA replication protein DnaC